MKYVRFLVLVSLPLLLALGMFAASATTLDEPKRASATSGEAPLEPQYTSKWAFVLACAWSQYSCWGVDRPHVEYEDMSNERGLQGYYMYGADTVYINKDLIGTRKGFVVIVHETIHYLQYKSGAWELTFEGGRAAHCGLEEEAFNVTYRVTQAIGWEYDYTWRGWDAMRAYTYGCPEDPPNPTLEGAEPR